MGVDSLMIPSFGGGRPQGPVVGPDDGLRIRPPLWLRGRFSRCQASVGLCPGPYCRHRGPGAPVSLVAAALLHLTQLGTHLLCHPQRQAWLRQVRSRRRSRSELSILTVVCHLLDHGAALGTLLTPHTILNLEAAL